MFRPDQVAEEASLGLRAAVEAQRILGLPVDHVRLSLRDESDGWLGSRAQWDAAENALREAGRNVLAGAGLELAEARGEAAFYRPKLDLQVRSPRGHEETIATVQLDFNQPERFDLTYHGQDGEQHRVVMVHRGTVGSMERVVAALLERYQGRLPLWLTPVQVAVLPVSAAQDHPGRELVNSLCAKGLRAELRCDGSLGARVRHCHERRDHLVAVLGGKETSAAAVQVTDIGSDHRETLPVARFVDLVADAYARRLPLVEWAA